MAATAKATVRNVNATVQALKPEQGYLCSLQVLNGSAAPCYVQLFDQPTTASVTLATTIPDMQILVAAGAQVNVPLPSDGISFRSGIMVAATTGDTGLTGSAAGVTVYAQFT